jgi:hypothetical protein
MGFKTFFRWKVPTQASKIQACWMYSKPTHTKEFGKVNNELQDFVV